MISFFDDIQFAEKGWFWLLLLIPAFAGFYIWRLNKREPEFNYSSLNLFTGIRPSFRVRFRHSLIVLRLLALTGLIFALARPQSRSSWKDTKTEGIDIVISMDVSLSMLAKDFKPNRLEVAKEVILEFIDQRPNDRIGLVLFGGQVFTQCPLTTDHKVLKNMFLRSEQVVLIRAQLLAWVLQTLLLASGKAKLKARSLFLLVMVSIMSVKFRH